MRVINFSPGPSVLPLPVLERAAQEITDVNGSGQSIMEMSHRSKDFIAIIEKTEALLRELMGIPSNYRVLFLQGGGSLQFAMLPLNLGAGATLEAPKRRATYIDTGIWASKAAEEGAKYVDAVIGASSKDRNYSYIPEAPAPAEGDAFYHITLNNTIVGTKWNTLPPPGAAPLVSDISSCILSQPLDVSQFGLVYAGAQKNLGPAGVTIVIIRDDLIGHAPPWVPVMLRYDIHDKDASMYNTPPCHGIYIVGLVLEWMQANGGVVEMEKRNLEKAALLYEFLENSKLFLSPVEKPFRSIMNITFVVNREDAKQRADLEAKFIQEATDAGLVNLAGHRLVGGMRASIYNAMTIQGVRSLVEFMEKFEAREA